MDKLQSKYSNIKLILLFWIPGLLFIKFLPADVIHLKDDRFIFGQALAVNNREAIIETISNVDGVLEISAVSIDKIAKIVDESGILLFDKENPVSKNLNSYYSLMENNWEELKFKLIPAANHKIVLNTGEEVNTKIVSITSEFVFTEKQQKDSVKITIHKISMNNILKINGLNIKHTNLDIPKRIILQEIKFPVYSLSVGPDYVLSNYSSLRALFQDFYEQNEITNRAGKRLDNYTGIYFNFEFYLKPYLAFGLSAQYYFDEKINALALTLVDVKYVYRTSSIHPWLSIGFAGQSFKSSEIADGTKYSWSTSKSSICLGSGFISGKILGFGIDFSVYYMPFGKGQTKIKIDGPDQLLAREIDYSLIKISLGMHYNFN